MVINWALIAIGILAVFIVSKVIHFRHFKHRVSAILLIVLALFLYTTFTAVIKTNHIDLKTAQGLISAGKVYSSWLFQAFGNVKSLTGNAVKMDGIPSNMSISSTIG
jgi:hypothetical protein